MSKVYIKTIQNFQASNYSRQLSFNRLIQEVDSKLKESPINFQTYQNYLASFNCPLTFLLIVLLGSFQWLGVSQNWDEIHQTTGTSLHHRCHAISESEDLQGVMIAILHRHSASWD